MEAAESLKRKLKALGESLPQVTRVRLHRSISWLKRAEAESKDADARFIFLWIAFNAAYAQEFGTEKTERDLLRQFLQKLLRGDSGGTLQAIAFDQFSGPVRLLVENKFVFEPFWRALREHDSSGEWERRFTADRKTALKAVTGRDTLTALGIVFDRLYVLRNQLVHGGATWNSKVNRQQVRDGANMLHSLLPAIIGLMIALPDVDFGSIEYPVI